MLLCYTMRWDGKLIEYDFYLYGSSPRAPTDLIKTWQRGTWYYNLEFLNWIYLTGNDTHLKLISPGGSVTVRLPLLYGLPRPPPESDLQTSQMSALTSLSSHLPMGSRRFRVVTMDCKVSVMEPWKWSRASTRSVGGTFRGWAPWETVGTCPRRPAGRCRGSWPASPWPPWWRAARLWRSNQVYHVYLFRQQVQPLITIRQEGNVRSMKSESVIVTTEVKFEMGKQFVTEDGGRWGPVRFREERNCTGCHIYHLLTILFKIDYWFKI